jgi:hypothetical protein
MEIVFNPDMRVVYACRFFESKRHSKPHTTMYFLKPEHTAWAFLDNLSKIEMIFEPITSDIYKQALFNTKKTESSPERIREHSQFKHLFIKDCKCLTHGQDKCLKEFVCKECHSCMNWMGYEEGQETCIDCNIASGKFDNEE